MVYIKYFFIEFGVKSTDTMISSSSKIVSVVILMAVAILFSIKHVNVMLNQAKHGNWDEPNLGTPARLLSTPVDQVTGENLQTVNGKVPEVSCPVGHYRPPGSTVTKRVSGQREDGCHRCPRGRYGASVGLTSSSCSAACPVGTYGDQEGLESADQCPKCPPGSFGIFRGMKTASCSGLCPAGKYSDTFGATSCKVCPPHYHMWQCSKDIDK